MKIRIELDENVREPEIVLRCARLDGEAARAQAAIVDALNRDRRLALVRDGRDYYLPADDMLFFEAVDGKTWAHTAQHIYEIRLRLCELGNILPPSFTRIGKSAIVNTRRILSITHNLAGPSLVRFRGSVKRINVSRGYYKSLVNKLSERSFYESK